jgi:hypothetical protein
MRSTLKRLSSFGVALAALAGIASDDLSAQAGPSDARLRASVGIRATPNRQNDAPGGTYVGDDMLPGESARLNVTVGRGDDLCFSSVWASESGTLPPTAQARVNEQEASAHYVWRFDVRMLEVTTDRIKFDLSWERTSRKIPTESLRQTVQMTLREGESRPIDLLHGKEGSNCMGVVLEVTAGIIEDSTLLGKTLEWDLWFSGARTQSVHRALTSPQGESAAFQFQPVATTATQLNGKVDAVFVQVYGQLRGRIRLDGSIDVALNTNRIVNFDLSAKPNSTLPRRLSPAGGSGQKNFTIKPGEAVKIVLPPLDSGGRVQFRTDSVNGEKKAIVLPPTAAKSNAPTTSEMSITVQARVQE